MMFYTTLAFSDSQEEAEKGNDLPLKYFNMIAMPLICFMYFTLFLGIIGF